MYADTQCNNYSMTPQEFVPKYDNTVQVINAMNGVVNNIQGKGYALTTESAEEMVTMLDDNGMGPVTLVRAYPWPSYGPFVFNHDVPWIKFPSGEIRNAGKLGLYWGMPGVPLKDVLKYVKIDVETPVEGQ